jgi:hypothetical protein
MASDEIVRHRPTALWQLEAMSRARELRSLCDLFEASDHRHDTAAKDSLVESIRGDLDAGIHTALQAGPPSTRLKEWLSGARVQFVASSLDAAEVTLLRLAPLEFLRSNLPVLVADARDRLQAKDPRLGRLETVAKAADGTFTEQERAAVVSAADAAKKASLQAQARLRSFRNVVLIATCMATTLAITLALIGIFAPDTLPLCYFPEGGDQVCPASGSPRPADSLLVEFAGVLGATISAVVSLRKVRGSADPYSVSVAQAVLKLPTGALTAFLGLLLISAGFVPGLSALDTSAQILAWAVVLGYSQELFTRLVDDQAQSVLAGANYGAGGQGGGAERSRIGSTVV